MSDGRTWVIAFVGEHRYIGRVSTANTDGTYSLDEVRHFGSGWQNNGSCVDSVVSIMPIAPYTHGIIMKGVKGPFVHVGSEDTMHEQIRSALDDCYRFEAQVETSPHKDSKVSAAPKLIVPGDSNATGK